MGEQSLLLVTHVHVRHGPNGPQIDDQTAAGIDQWCRHFDRVTFYGVAAQGTSTSAWVDAEAGVRAGRVSVKAFPAAYGVGATLRAYRAVRRELRAAIPRHRHLCFTLGLLLGDWPLVGAREAIRQRRRFSAWIDRVEGPIVRGRVRGTARRAAAAVLVAAGERAIRRVLSRSTVALLQGGDTFTHYAADAPDPHVTYDTHTHADERIAAAAVAAKQARARSGAPLDIVYVGRAAAMKGPLDWLAVLEGLRRDGVDFRATWIGDGPDLAEMRMRAATIGLGEVAFPGFEDRRDVLLDRLRAADLLLFCHKTPESARVLIEALVCGCPVVGYDSAYPRDLVAAQGGGAFVPPGDVDALAAAVARLDADRAALAALIAAAAASGVRFTEEAVYAHRAALMQRG